MRPPKYFFRVHLVGRFVPLVGVISRPVESPLYTCNIFSSLIILFTPDISRYALLSDPLSDLIFWPVLL